MRTNFVGPPKVRLNKVWLYYAPYIQCPLFSSLVKHSAHYLAP